MVVGDLVGINDSPLDARGKGIVLKFDVYTNSRFSSIPEPIVEVSWANNSIGWILKKRLDILTHACKYSTHMV